MHFLSGSGLKGEMTRIVLQSENWQPLIRLLFRLVIEFQLFIVVHLILLIQILSLAYHVSDDDLFAKRKFQSEQKSILSAE